MSYITVVKPISNFCGKQFHINNEGGIVKSSRAAAPARSIAKTMSCDSLEMLGEIIDSLSEGEAIILGYVPETIGVEQFHLWSVTQMKRAFKEVGELIEEDNEVERSRWIVTDNGGLYLPRKKQLFARSPFICIDRDVDEHAPENIKTVQSMSNNQFLKILCEGISDDVANAFYGADFLPVASSSGQVFTTDGTPYVSDPSAHLFFKVDNPDDIDRFGAALFAQAMANGYSYNKEINRKDNVNAYRKQTIFDPSVFTAGRLFFESSPKIGDGLEIRKDNCRVVSWSGRPVRTECVRDPNHDVLEKLRQQNIDFHTGRMGSHFSSEGLYPEMVVDTQKLGKISVSAYESGQYGKLRCQTPFRESSSWAAYLNKHDDGEVYLWDEGSRTKYRLIKNDEELKALYTNAKATVERELSKIHAQACADYEEMTEECEMVSGDTVTTMVDEYEQDLAALVEFEEQQVTSNVVPLHAQFAIDDIEEPEEQPLSFELWDGTKFEESDLRTPKQMYVWGNGALVKGGFSLLGGAPKVGKSDLLLTLMMAAACGGDFLGYQFEDEMTVLWIQAELMPEFLKERYDEAIAFFDVKDQKKIRNNLIITGRGNRQLNGSDNLDYKRMMEQVKPDLVAIDPLRNLMSVANEVDASEMVGALSSIKDSAIGINPDVSIIAVHHLRKGSEKGKSDPFDMFAGSGALRGFYDTGIVMLNDENLPSHKHLFWEVRNGKALDPMEVVRGEEGGWRRNGGVIESAMKATNAKVPLTNEEKFKHYLVELLKSDKVIGKDNAVPWAQVRGKMKLIMDGLEITLSERTMDKYAKDAYGVNLVSVGKGKGSNIFYGVNG